MSSLPLSRAVAVLLPQIPRAQVLPQHGEQEVSAQLKVQLSTSLLLIAWLQRVMVQCVQGEVVDVDPDGTSVQIDDERQAS